MHLCLAVRVYGLLVLIMMQNRALPSQLIGTVITLFLFRLWKQLRHFKAGTRSLLYQSLVLHHALRHLLHTLLPSISPSHFSPHPSLLYEERCLLFCGWCFNAPLKEPRLERNNEEQSN